MAIQPNIGFIVSNPLGSQPKAVVTMKLYASTAAATGTFISPEGACSDLLITLAGLTSETVAVTYSHDGTNFVAIGNVIDTTTGKDTTGATLANGTYSIPVARFGNFKHIKLTKSSTSESLSAAVSVASLDPYF